MLVTHVTLMMDGDPPSISLVFRRPSFQLSAYPSQPSIMFIIIMSSSVHQPLTLLFSLSDTPRNKLLEWYEDVCAQARGLCAAFDIAGALSLVAYPTEWNAYPGNLC